MRAVGVVIVGALVVGAIGCGQVDPCGSQPGVCVSLRVEGSVKSLDQLAVTVDKPMTKTQTTAVQPLSLPLAIALGLPPGASGAVRVSVVGLARGSEIAAGAGVATIVADRAKIVVTLAEATGVAADMSAGGDGGGSDGGAGADMLGRGSQDMANCGAVSACVDGDNCCPSGCNAKSDNDCAAVCGNGVLEPGEVCDDDNTTGGDGCDPTCSWHEELHLVSGSPHASGHADGTGPITRLSTPRGITYDAANQVLYVSSSDDCTIRKVSGDFTTATLTNTTTLVGSPWSCQDVEGFVSTALLNAPNDLEFLGNAIYVAEDTANKIRVIDLATNKTGTVESGVLAYGLGQYKGSLAFYDQNAANAGLRLYNPTTLVTTTPVPASSFTAAGVTNGGKCQDVACDGTYCYVACTTSVARVTMANNTVVNFAGVYNAGSASWTTGCTSGTVALAASPFTNVSRISLSPDGVIDAVDTGCNDVIELGSATVVVAGQPSSAGGFADGAGASAAFDQPLGVVSPADHLAYVADSSNQVVRSVNGTVSTLVGPVATPPTVLTTVPTTSVSYGEFFVSFATDGSYAYLVDNGGNLTKTSLTTGAAATLPLATGWPVGVSPQWALAWAGRIYVSGNGVIASVDPDGYGASVFAGTAGKASPPSDGPRLSAIMAPHALATDGTNLFFTDGWTEVRYIDAAGMVHTLAGDPAATDVVDGVGKAAHFANAGALATDGKFVYVADGTLTDHTAIRRVEIATQKVDTIAGSPSMFGHVDGPAAGSLFSSLNSIAYDGKSLFLADPDASPSLLLGPTIRQLDLQTMTVSTMIGLAGQQTFKVDIGKNARVHFPRPLVMDATTHSLFFFDIDEGVLAAIK